MKTISHTSIRTASLEALLGKGPGVRLSGDPTFLREKLRTSKTYEEQDSAWTWGPLRG